MTATVEAEASTQARPSEQGPRSFALGLLGIAIGALAVRVGTAFFYDAHTKLYGDAVWYWGVAGLFAHGDGFLQPFEAMVFQRVPTAAHPPLYAMYLSAVDLTFGSSVLLHRLWSCLPGTGTVVLLGLTARDLAGRRAGLIAAGLAALSIELFVQDTILWSEGMYGFTIALTLFAAYRYVRRPDLLHVGLLAAAIALAALTRAEAVLLFVVLLVPLVLRNRSQPMGRRVGALGVGAVVAMVFIAPWLIYNNSGRFEHPVGITVTFGTLIGSSNCRATYFGSGIGGWGGDCRDTIPRPWPRDESEAERRAQDAGFDYMSGHLDRLPLVVSARIGRTFGFYAPNKSISDALLLEEAKIHRLTYLALAQYWLYLGLAVAGAVVLKRQRVTLIPFLAPVATVLVITVIGYGAVRFRMALDVILPVLAAVAIERWLTRRAGAAADPVVVR
ncbi:MAG: ArnT family glycosyltransferase [Acidimicrobiia bacterium]